MPSASWPRKIKLQADSAIAALDAARINFMPAALLSVDRGLTQMANGIVSTSYICIGCRTPRNTWLWLATYKPSCAD